MNVNIYHMDSSSVDVSKNSSLQPEKIKFLDIVKSTDLICPLSKKINLDPMQLSPCGHTFDRKTITQFFHQKTTEICPIETCKQYVNIRVIDPFFKKVINSFIEKISQPTQEVKNNMIELSHVLPPSQNKIKIQKAIQLLSEAKTQEAIETIISLDQTALNNPAFIPILTLINKHMEDVTNKHKALFQIHNQPTPTNNSSHFIPTVRPTEEKAFSIFSEPFKSFFPPPLINGGNFSALSPPLYYSIPLPGEQSLLTLSNALHSIPLPTIVEEEVEEKSVGSQNKRLSPDYFDQPLAKRRRLADQDLPVESQNNNSAGTIQSQENEKPITAQIVSFNQDSEQSLEKNITQAQEDRLFSLITFNASQAITYIKKISNVNFQDHQGNTPLHHVILKYRSGKALIEALCAKKINLNAQNLNGETALYIAAKMNKIGFLNLLLSKGALKTIPNNQNQLPIQVATKEKAQKILRNF